MEKRFGYPELKEKVYTDNMFEGIFGITADSDLGQKMLGLNCEIFRLAKLQAVARSAGVREALDNRMYDLDTQFEVIYEDYRDRKLDYDAACWS